MKFVKFAIVCSVIPLLFLRSLQAEDIEERLERQVNRLIEILLQMPASEEAVGELQDIRQALEEIRPAPSIQPPPQGQTEPPLTATVVSTPVTDYEEPVQMLYLYRSAKLTRLCSDQVSHPSTAGGEAFFLSK